MAFYLKKSLEGSLFGDFSQSLPQEKPERFESILPLDEFPQKKLNRCRHSIFRTAASTVSQSSSAGGGAVRLDINLCMGVTQGKNGRVVS